LFETGTSSAVVAQALTVGEASSTETLTTELTAVTDTGQNTLRVGETSGGDTSAVALIVQIVGLNASTSIV